MSGDGKPGKGKSGKKKDSKFNKLSMAIKTCIVEAVRDDNDVIEKLQACHQKEGDEIKCFKSLPELADCFSVKD